MNKKKSGMYISGFYAPSNMMLPKISDYAGSYGGDATIGISEDNDSAVPALPTEGTINIPVASSDGSGTLVKDKSEWSGLGLGGEIGYNFGSFSVGALVDYRKYEDDSTSSDSGTSGAGGAVATTLIEGHAAQNTIDPLGYDSSLNFTTIPLNIYSVIKGEYTNPDNRAVRYADLGADGGITNGSLNILDIIYDGASVSISAKGELPGVEGSLYDVKNDNLVTNGELGQSDGLKGRLLGFKAVSTGTTTASAKISKMEKVFLGAIVDYNINISPKFAAFIGAGAGVDMVKGSAKITGGSTSNIFVTAQDNPISAFEATGPDAIYKFTPSDPESLILYKLKGGEFIHEGQRHPVEGGNSYATIYKILDSTGLSTIPLDGTNGPIGIANSLLVAKYSEPFMLDKAKLPAHNMKLDDADYDDSVQIATYTSDIDMNFDTSVFAAQGRIGVEYRISDFIAPYITYTARYSASKDITVGLPSGSGSGFGALSIDATNATIVPHKVTIEHENCDLNARPTEIALAKPAVATTVAAAPDTANTVTISDPSSISTRADSSSTTASDNVKVSIPSALDHVFTIGVRFYF